MRKLVVIAIICFFVNSCKENTSKTNDGNSDIERKTSSKDLKEELVVRMNVEYLKSDTIWLFYTENYEQDFFPIETALTQQVKGQEGSQWVTFEFPKEIFPERLKIRFSNNKSQQSINLKEIQFIREGNILSIEGQTFVNYFNFSKFVSTPDGYELRFNTVDDIYDPNIVSSSQFDTELIKL